MSAHAPFRACMEPGADTGTSTGRPMLAVLGGLGRLVTAEWFKRYRENDRPMPRCTRTNWYPSYSDTRSSHGGLLECGIVLRKPLIALEHVLPIHDRQEAGLNPPT
jgi:hypothetical protein